jgi:hypothetical protein
METRATALLGIASVIAGCEFINRPSDGKDPSNIGEAGEVCGEYDLETGAKVLFVLDKSGTMFGAGQAWDHDDDPATEPVSRWRSLHAVVELLVARFDAKLNMGALLFPSTDSQCHVNKSPEIPIAASNGETLLAQLPEADAFYDEFHLTPLPTALEYAVEYMRGFDARQSRAIVLVSDGVPSVECDGNLTTAAHTLEAAWTMDGIPTYVVGVAIEGEYGPEFAALADAGGKPAPGSAYYDTQDEIELETAIDEIARSISNCRVGLEDPPTYPELFEIRLDGETLSQVASCETGDGWVFVGEDMDAIELCGAACATLSEGGHALSAFYGC